MFYILVVIVEAACVMDYIIPVLPTPVVFWREPAYSKVCFVSLHSPTPPFPLDDCNINRGGGGGEFFFSTRGSKSCRFFLFFLFLDPLGTSGILENAKFKPS